MSRLKPVLQARPFIMEVSLIRVEKNSELPQGDFLRKFQGRLVFLGDQAKDQN